MQTGEGKMSEETKKVGLIEIEVNKISLNPGDVLLAKVSGPDFAEQEVCEAFKESLKSVFPNNRIGVLFLDKNQVDISVISQETAQALENVLNSENNACNSANFCNNCSCGKKEAALGQPLDPKIEEMAN